MNPEDKSESEILAESTQFWSQDQLDDEKVEAIEDPRARAYARSSLETRKLIEEGHGE